MTAPTRSQLLCGPFAPVGREWTADRLDVDGVVPPELSGTYLRNGPNPRFPPPCPFGLPQWMDGDGMVHAVSFDAGRASYRNRYVRTDGFAAETAAGRALYGSWMDAQRLPAPPSGAPRFKNPANTAVLAHHGRLLALWEGGKPHELEPETLATIGPYDFGGALTHPFCAHPKVDPENGELIAFGSSYDERPYCRYYEIDRGGRLVHSRAIDLIRPVQMHDFAVTNQHAILLDLPLVFNAGDFLRGRDSVRFRSDVRARYGVVRRGDAGAPVKWFQGRACMVIHVVGAWEEGREIVLVALRRSRPPRQFSAAEPPPSPDPARAYGDLFEARLHRWTFDLESGETREEELSERPLEFPRIDEARTTRRFRFAYGMAADGHGLLKFDLQAGAWTEHELGATAFGSEPSFVPRPGRASEDDGYVLAFVQHASPARGELRIVDARSFGSPPVARVWLPDRVPLGFHGTWLGGR